MMSPSCKLPSLVASPVLVISLMKIWLPSRRPYSASGTVRDSFAAWHMKHATCHWFPIYACGGSHQWYFVFLSGLEDKGGPEQCSCGTSGQTDSTGQVGRVTKILHIATNLADCLGCKNKEVSSARARYYTGLAGKFSFMASWSDWVPC